MTRRSPDSLLQYSNQIYVSALAEADGYPFFDNFTCAKRKSHARDECDKMFSLAHLEAFADTL